MKDFSDVWQPGLSLPQAVYTDPVCFDADMARLMRDQWFLVDHASRIAKPGDYFLTQIGAESVIVTRNRAGEVKAFYNACRHRGSRVCLEREGSRRTFTCPYHAWTYDLDGALRSAQHMPEDFDRSQHGLKPVGVGEFEGLIFLNFAEPDQAPDFAAYTERFAPLLRGQGVETIALVVGPPSMPPEPGIRVATADTLAGVSKRSGCAAWKAVISSSVGSATWSRKPSGSSSR